MRTERHTRSKHGALLAVLAMSMVAGCGSETAGGPADQTVSLYTCVSDTTIQPVIKAFEQKNPHSHIDLFRAPTGQLNARVAADVRSGGLRADVIWGCDPLTMQSFAGQDLVGGWTPPAADTVPSQYRTADYVGVALLYMVAVYRTGVPAPQAWSDLSGSAYTNAVAVPDPSVAASALGALGYFAADPAYGVDFYGALKKNGAVQVSTPDDVSAGVAQGVYKAGITIANSAYAAKDRGSPIDVVWPKPGAVAVYGPVALAKHANDSGAAKDFISFLVSRDGQTVIGDSGSYPTLAGIRGPTIPDGAPVVSPDWAAISKNKDAVLGKYRQLFGR